MDKEKILEEGLLEKYLMGELSPSQIDKVEHHLASNKDLRDEYGQMEADFEKLAFENAINPPSAIKTKLSVHLAPEKKAPMPTFWLWTAASLAGIFLLTSIIAYTQLQATKNTLSSLQNEAAALETTLASFKKEAQLTNAQMALIKDPKTAPFVLVGNAKLSGSILVAYVNHEQKKVLANTNGLPQLPPTETYQMWGDVDGEMINMGLLPQNSNLVPMKYIDHAESLNITIEPAGGNDHPTVERLISQVVL